MIILQNGNFFNEMGLFFDEMMIIFQIILFKFYLTQPIACYFTFTATRLIKV